MDLHADLPTCGTGCVTPSFLRRFWFGQWVRFTETKLDKTEILHVLCLVEASPSLPLCPCLGAFSGPERIYSGPLLCPTALANLSLFPSYSLSSTLLPQR